MKKNIVIIILSVLVIGLGGYLVFDKVINKKDNEKPNVVSNQPSANQEVINAETNDNIVLPANDTEEGSEKSSNAFALNTIGEDSSIDEVNEYLKYFMPSVFPNIYEYSGKTIDDEFVTRFVYWTIHRLVLNEKIDYIQGEEYYIYIVNKKYVDDIINTYFDGNYSINSFSMRNTFGLFDYDENNYKFSYQPTGYYPDTAISLGTGHDENSYYANYLMVSTMSKSVTGELKFYFKCKNSTCKVEKIIFDKI